MLSSHRCVSFVFCEPRRVFPSNMIRRTNTEADKPLKINLAFDTSRKCHSLFNFNYSYGIPVIQYEVAWSDTLASLSKWRFFLTLQKQTTHQCLYIKVENFLSLFCFQSNAGTYMFASKHLLWRFYQINDFKHAQIKTEQHKKRHHRQVLLEFSPATSSTTKNLRALIWILITAAQRLCLSHSFSALKRKIGCYFSNHTVMAREFDSICVQVCLCARETEREKRSDSSFTVHWDLG